MTSPTARRPVRPRRRVAVPCVLLVLLVLSLGVTTFLGSWWFAPRTPHAATDLGWVAVWAVTAVAVVVTAVLLVTETVRRRARWLWLLVVPVVVVSTSVAWTTRLESYGPTSDPDDQTWVWPFTAPG